MHTYGTQTPSRTLSHQQNPGLSDSNGSLSLPLRFPMVRPASNYRLCEQVRLVSGRSGSTCRGHDRGPMAVLAVEASKLGCRLVSFVFFGTWAACRDWLAASSSLSRASHGCQDFDEAGKAMEFSDPGKPFLAVFLLEQVSRRLHEFAAVGCLCFASCGCLLTGLRT